MPNVGVEQGAHGGGTGQVQGGDSLPTHAPITEDITHREGLLFGRYTDEDGTLKRSRERGCGGASQVAIFRRKKSREGEGVTSAADAAATVKGAVDGSGDKPAALFWSWDKHGCIDNNQGDTA